MNENNSLLDSELQGFVSHHSGWKVENQTLVRTFEAPTFLRGIALVEQIGQAAERADHHPDIDIRWRKVTVRLTTHDAGNRITALDVRLAQECEALFQKV